MIPLARVLIRAGRRVRCRLTHHAGGELWHGRYLCSRCDAVVDPLTGRAA